MLYDSDVFPVLGEDQSACRIAWQRRSRPVCPEVDGVVQLYCLSVYPGQFALDALQAMLIDGNILSNAGHVRRPVLPQAGVMTNIDAESFTKVKQGLNQDNVMISVNYLRFKRSQVQVIDCQDAILCEQRCALASFGGEYEYV